MMSKKLNGSENRRTKFICQQCGRESLKWMGRCPDCNEWNTFIEVVQTSAKKQPLCSATAAPAQELSSIQVAEYPRISLPYGEINRVLGGGIVPGSLILISGDPGIGKSTLLLQIAMGVTASGKKVAYISGEESLTQLKLRAHRLHIKGDKLYIINETALESIISTLDQLSPQLAIVDSIQTLNMEEIPASPGSIVQVRECTLRLMQWSKENNTPVFISGHVTKEGSIAGPKTLEHIVDVVLYIEGENYSAYRLLRSMKNRFGATNEVGVFEMTDRGMSEVSNPSMLFLSQREEGAIGSAIVVTVEGTRPMMLEIQALTTPSIYTPPRRISTGIDINRLLMISAVLSRRAGISLSNQDILINVIGGIKIGEPAVDLGVALAIGSTFKDRAIVPGTVAIGELGLCGEIRPVSKLDLRLSEAARLNFKRCLLPKTQLDSLHRTMNIELLPVSNIREAFNVALSHHKEQTI